VRAKSDGRRTCGTMARSVSSPPTSSPEAALEAKLPGPLKPLAKHVVPAVATLREAAVAAEPYVTLAIEKAQVAWKAVEPYHPEDMAPAAAGAVMLFFGGSFVTTIAAVEAFRITGYTPTLEAVKQLHSSYVAAVEANKKDDEVDADGDGVADVKQISAEQLAVRKLALLAKTLDPAKLEEALGAIAAGLVAVVATLRARFAKTVTLGLTLSDNLADNVVVPHLRPAALGVLPPEYHKWCDAMLRYACRFVGVSLAWMAQRVISAFHAAARGAQLLVSGAAAYGERHGYVNKGAVVPGTTGYNATVAALAAAGFWWQLRAGFALPFPFNLVLLPARLLEWGLQHWVSAE